MWLSAPYALLLIILRVTDAATCPEGIDARVVSNTAEASELGEALLCSGAGYFEVDWIGEVVLERSIIISNGSSVKVTGVDPGEAVIDGGDAIRLFQVSGSSTLLLNGLSLVGGFVTSTESDDDEADYKFEFRALQTVPEIAQDGSGGAVFVADEDSRLTASTCTFARNSADARGGMYVCIQRVVQAKGGGQV